MSERKKIITFGSAVNLGDESVSLAFEIGGELVPIGGHLLAMSAPGGVPFELLTKMQIQLDGT